MFTNNKSVIRFIIISITIFFFSMVNMAVAYADTLTPAFVSGVYVNVRSGAGTNYPNVQTVNNDDILLENNCDVSIINIANSPKDGSGYTWYNISFNYDGNQYVGYMRSDFVALKITYNPEPQNDYERELQTKGFPYTYWPYLTALHQKYSNWQFLAINTNLDWNTAVNEESYVGKSLIQGNEGYRSTEDGSYDWYSNTWYVKEGSDWYAANSKAVAYYMDPRNFLNETRVFMFQDLTYHSDYIKSSTIDMVFSGSYSYLNPYSSNFVQSGSDSGVNPIYLAVLARQELGSSGSAAVSGQSFCYPNYNTKYTNEIGNCYSGYYNFFNIGAGTDAAPIYNSLIYAKNNGWSSPQLAITAGANFMGNAFIKKGQYTSYFKKYNVSPTAYYNHYSNQYMTNIQAPYSEASTAFNTYNSFGIINEALVFAIPVFNNMPDSTSLPSTGNPNNILKNLKVNNNTVQNYDPWQNSYDYYVSKSTSSVNIGTETVTSSTTVTNNGTINLTDDTTTINVVVTAGNGNVRTYTIRVIKTDTIPITIDDIINGLGFRINNSYLSKLGLGLDSGTIINRVNTITGQLATITIKTAAGTDKSGNMVTGDVVTIVNNNQTNNYTAVIYGDSSGDGSITIRDLLQVQKHILDRTGNDKLAGAYYVAGDTNKDGDITIRDLLQVQQHILNYSSIQQ